jgi:hypothetical protein
VCLRCPTGDRTAERDSHKEHIEHKGGPSKELFVISVFFVANSRVAPPSFALQISSVTFSNAIGPTHSEDAGGVAGESDSSF